MVDYIVAMLVKQVAQECVAQYDEPCCACCIPCTFITCCGPLLWLCKPCTGTEYALTQAAAVRGLQRGDYYVSLYTASMGVAGAKRVAAVLPRSTTTILNLTGQNLRDEGLAIICDALKTNTSLRRLYIALNRITKEGQNAIELMLHLNKTIVDIRLVLDSQDDGVTFRAQHLDMAQLERMRSLLTARQATIATGGAPASEEEFFRVVPFDPDNIDPDDFFDIDAALPRDVAKRLLRFYKKHDPTRDREHCKKVALWAEENGLPALQQLLRDKYDDDLESFPTRNPAAYKQFVPVFQEKV